MDENKKQEYDKSDRVYYFDYLRLVAIFAIMVIHVSAQNWNTANVRGFSWQIYNFYDSMVRWAFLFFL